MNILFILLLTLLFFSGVVILYLINHIIKNGIKINILKKNTLKIYEDENEFVKSESLKNHQDKLIDLFEYFINLCDKHNIHYVATGGTLLGSVRHKGIIPWDDDIDVALTKESIVKLKNLKDEINKDGVDILHGELGKFVYKDKYNGKIIWIDLFEYKKEDKLYLHAAKFFYNRSKEEIFHEKEFENTTTLPFNRLTIKVPTNYFRVVRRHFGNWEELKNPGTHQPFNIIF